MYDIYLTDENIAPVKIYITGSSEEFDIIGILDHTDITDSYEKIHSDINTKIQSDIDSLDSMYDISVNWVGKVIYKNKFNQICIGIKIN